MNHNYYNAEGYPDPTAFEALRNAESFQVDHPSGYVRIHPDTFFPSATSTAFQDIDTVWQGVLTAEQFCETVANELDNELDVVVPLTAPAEQ